MTILQVQLSNTYNEFRQTVNNVSNTVNAFTDGSTATPATFSNQSLFAAGVAANTLNVSTLTSGRVPFVASSGSITDASGLSFNSATAALTVAGNIKSGSLINLIAANGAIITTSNTYTTNSIGRHFQSIGVSDAITAGADWINNNGESQNQHLFLGVGNYNGSRDIAVINSNSGANAYAEFISYGTSGNSVDGWISTGINSNNYSQSQYTITGPDDGYLLYEPKNGSSGNGNLVIATGSGGRQNQIIIGAGGFSDPANNTQMVITPGQKVAITINTQSSNTTTGALVVNGGIGLRGNLNVGGNVAITGTITLGGGGNTVSTSTLTVDNPMIFLGSNNAADLLDLGLVGQYTSSGVKYSGLVRDHLDGYYKLFYGMATRPANTVAFAANTTYSTLQLGTLRAVDTTASSSKTTGALIVSGGIGANGAVYATSFTANTGATISAFTTDQTFAGAANTAVPTAWAVKTYVDNNSGTAAWTVKTTANNNYTAVSGDNLFCDTANGSFTVILPASPSNNAKIAIADVAGTFNTRPLIVNNNGNRLQGANNIVYLDMINTSISLVYNTTYGWRII
jgi:hypothetical protein